MERDLEETMTNVMGKPSVVGAICVDKKGLTLSARSRSQTPLLDETSSSSDDGEIAGSPKRSTKKGSNEILSGSVRSASFNIVFQVLTRVFTFLLNAFILRYYFKYFILCLFQIIGDTILIATRSFCLCLAVVKFPSSAIFSYAFGTLVGCMLVMCVYYGYFYYYIHYVSNAKRDLPFGSIMTLLPRTDLTKLPTELTTLVWTFFKQGVLKQLLTEGERYMMTFLDVLTFQEQGIYDLVSNLGSLAARFIFLPVEESAYSFFAQSLTKQAKSESKKMKEMMIEIGAVLGRLVRMMSLIGMIILVYGLPYSNTVLYLYGGERLSDEGPGTRLLQANCVYILTLALNGVTEAFTFAAMTKEQMDKFNKRLVWFSGIYLLAAWILTWYLGSIGFFIANSINMSLRIVQSCTLVQIKFAKYKVNAFLWWLPESKVVATFGISATLVSFLTLLDLGRVLFVFFGLIIFAFNAIAALYFDRDLTTFFLSIYKTKSA